MSDGRVPVRRRWLGWPIGIAVTLLVLAVGWLTVRGLGAVSDLEKVASASSELKSAIGAGDLETAESIAKRIEHHAASAHELTSDPIWRAFGYIPWLGPNFDAVREVATIADDVASDALTPVLVAAEDVDLAGLGFSGGTIDLAPFSAIEPPLAVADATLRSAEQRALRIDAGATLPPLADAITELRDSVTQAATVVGSLHGAAALLPTMLGGEGPRNYVIVMQNNAELRSSGGIVGAIALLHAEGGRITLTAQPSTSEFPVLDVPLPLSESTVALFEESPGRYIQNVTSIPDFTEAAPLIATRWRDRFGTDVDGVIAVDAVMTKSLLAATGPLTIGPFTADASTIVNLLLSEVYSAVPDPVAQDQIFAQAATAILGAALSGTDAKGVLAALAASADEGRIRIWSVHPEEQSILTSSTLAGALPADSDTVTHVGVLVNDATGGKMDFYADAEISIATGRCDGFPTTQVRVTWTNGAPTDAEQTLSPYVTGNGIFGVQAGNTRTLLTVYGPEGAVLAAADRDGVDEPVQTAILGGRPAVQHEVLLAPGESSTMTVSFTGGTMDPPLTRLSHTPLVNAPSVTRETLQCGQ